MNMIYLLTVLILIFSSLAVGLDVSTNKVTGHLVIHPISKVQVDNMIAVSALKHSIPPKLIEGFAFTESNFHAVAVSEGCGAAGIVQFMPGTAKQYGLKVFEDKNYAKCQDHAFLNSNPDYKKNCFGCNKEYADRLVAKVKDMTLQEAMAVDDRFNPEKAFDASAQFISSLLISFDGYPELAIAAYNQGGGRIKKHCVVNGVAQPLLSCIKKIPGHKDFDPANPEKDSLYRYVSKICGVYGACKQRYEFGDSAGSQAQAGYINKLLGKYRFMPSFVTRVNYSLDDYKKISEYVLKVIQKCEDPTNADSDCVKKALTEFFEDPFEANLNYCDVFTESERMCVLARRMVPTYTLDLVYDDCGSCDVLSCSDLRTRQTCYYANDKCGGSLNCEWFGSKCTPALGDVPKNGISEKECLKKNTKAGEELHVSYFVSGEYGECKKCSSLPKDCSNYVNERYCAMDPCKLGCTPYYTVAFFTDRKSFSRCGTCPPNPKCSDNPTDIACNSNCGLECYWEKGECRDKTASDLVRGFDPDRTYGICVWNKEKKLPYFIGGVVEELSVTYNFAIALKGKPPAPIKELNVVQFNHTDSEVLLYWNQSKEEKVKYYYVYAFGGSVDLNQAPYFTVKIDDSMLMTHFSREDIEYDPDNVTYGFDINGLDALANLVFVGGTSATPFFELKHNLTIRSFGDDKMYLYLSGLNPGSIYDFYVVAVSEDGDYVKDQTLYEVNESMLDNYPVRDLLSPGKMSKFNLSYSGGKYTIEFDLQDNYTSLGGKREKGSDGVYENEDGLPADIQEPLVLRMYYLDKEVSSVFANDYGDLNKAGIAFGSMDVTSSVSGREVKTPEFDLKARLPDLYLQHPDTGQWLPRYDSVPFMFVLTDKTSDDLAVDPYYNPQPVIENNHLTIRGDLVKQGDHYILENIESSEYME